MSEKNDTSGVPTTGHVWDDDLGDLTNQPPKWWMLGLTASVSLASAADEIVVYSARNEQLIKPLFDAYTAESGTPIKFITDKEGPLLERVKAEGKNTPADLLLTVDAGNLWLAAKEGVLAPVKSKTLRTNIPAHLRDPDNRWFGLSVRARTIVYSTERVKPAELSTYEALGDAKWKDRLCLRTSKKVYNQSLVAMMIEASYLYSRISNAIVDGCGRYCIMDQHRQSACTFEDRYRDR